MKKIGLVGSGHMGQSTNKKALFIDRDGVICRMVKYGEKYDSAQKVEDIKLVDGVSRIVKWANENGILAVEISNQPGVAKGKMSRELSEAIEAKAHLLLRKQRAVINHKYICLHHPRGVVAELTQECDCRKPKPGLILQAARDLDIDLASSLYLGDKASDALAGKASGVKTIIYLHDEDDPQKVEETKNQVADFKSPSMDEVLQIVRDYFCPNVS